MAELSLKIKFRPPHKLHPNSKSLFSAICHYSYKLPLAVILRRHTMNFQLNKNLGNWLKQLNGKTVDKIFQVDFNKERNEDIYLPWLFFIIFTDFDKFLEIEGDFDGDHIRINLYDNSELDKKLKENNLPNEPDLWRVYETNKDETLGQFLKVQQQA